MMNQDKKSILQEIEVLIRSIKVHYDNLENESRIPSIELELITSKIRKLHEKSIIYNHLHYLEEEQNQFLKRLKQEDEKPAQVQKYPENEKPTTLATETEHRSPINPIIPTPVQTKEEQKPIENPAVNTSPEIVLPVLNQTIPEKKTNPEPIDFKRETNINLGLNDRIWLTRELFEGNADELNLAINTLKNSASLAEFNQHLHQLKAKYNWKDEEAEESFKSLFRAK
jgi:hypothetical protein